MTKLTVLPHETLCPQGAEIEAVPRTSICDTLLDHGIEIEHACEKSCACTTCHVIVKSGFNKLSESSEQEEDLLDKAPGLTPTSRLACQAVIDDPDAEIVVVIPRYTINQISEGGAGAKPEP